MAARREQPVQKFRESLCLARAVEIASDRADVKERDGLVVAALPRDKL